MVDKRTDHEKLFSFCINRDKLKRCNGIVTFARRCYHNSLKMIKNDSKFVELHPPVSGRKRTAFLIRRITSEWMLPPPG